MIFLVPDLERYDAVRGGVIDYAPTAPGPQVTTTARWSAWSATWTAWRDVRPPS